MSDPSLSLGRRGLTSSGWRLGTSLASVGVLFLRAVLLARLLDVATFGVYALGFAVVRLSAVIADFGLSDAFLHRCRETEDEDRAAAVHLALTCLFTVGWAVTLIAVALWTADGPLRTALVVLAIAGGILQLARTPTAVLIRRVRHRRLALIDLLNAVLTTVVSVGLALRGAELWALLATDVATAAVAIAALYLWRPVWRPRLAWTPRVVRYYLGFGLRGFAAQALNRALERIDNLWTGAVLGTTALGFYSRAFTFATYPRRFVAQPILDVVAGVYAELAVDRERLGRTFRHTNALLVRGGFGVAGLLGLAAPALVALLLGERWLAMVPPFRVLLLFGLAAPVATSLVQLHVAVGEPGSVLRVRVIQLVVVLAGMAPLGSLWGATGVAAAMTLGVYVLLGLLLASARRHVTLATGTLFLAPLVATVAAVAATVGARAAVRSAETDPIQLGLVIGVFAPTYAVALFLLEGPRLMRWLRELRR